MPLWHNLAGVRPFWVTLFLQSNSITIGKNSSFQQRKRRWTLYKRFDCWKHLVVMLYAVIMRCDSLREITASLLAETHKLAHLGITFKIGRSTLADANKRRPEAIFEAIYRDLYATYRIVLSSDSHSRKTLYRTAIITLANSLIGSRLQMRPSSLILKLSRYFCKI